MKDQDSQRQLGGPQQPLSGSYTHKEGSVSRQPSAAAPAPATTAESVHATPGPLDDAARRNTASRSNDTTIPKDEEPVLALRCPWPPCTKSYGIREQLAMHVKNKHTKYPFWCPRCGRKYEVEGSAVRHGKEKHGIDLGGPKWRLYVLRTPTSKLVRSDPQ